VSNPDSFIAEVTEEVRRDQLYQTFRRYGWIAIALVLLLVGGAAWREYSKSQMIAAAEAQGDAILAALETPDDATRAAAMAAVTVDGAAAGVAALLTAAEQEKAGDMAGAVLTLDQMAGLPDVDPLYRDLASLKSLMLQADTLDPATLKQNLGLLAAPGAPFRLLAQEQMAMVDLGAGDTEAALVTLAAIAADAQVTSGLRDRVNGLIVALGGELAAAAPVEGAPAAVVPAE
jgi:hypothetical protein